MAALALQLSLGPPEAEGSSQGGEGIPRRPAVLLSTSARDGVEAASRFSDRLLERAWIASGNHSSNSSSSSNNVCDLRGRESVDWGAGPISFYTRNTASRRAAVSLEVLRLRTLPMHAGVDMPGFAVLFLISQAGRQLPSCLPSARCWRAAAATAHLKIPRS